MCFSHPSLPFEYWLLLMPPVVTNYNTASQIHCQWLVFFILQNKNHALINNTPFVKYTIGQLTKP